MFFFSRMLSFYTFEFAQITRRFKWSRENAKNTEHEYEADLGRGERVWLGKDERRNDKNTKDV